MDSRGKRRGWRLFFAGCIAVIAALWATSLATGFTMCLIVQEVPRAASPPGDLQPGALVRPLEGLNFDEGDWTAYVVLESADHGELPDLPRNVWRLTDREQMKKLQQELTATYTGSDVATVLSRLVFLQDGELRFDSGIVVEGWGFRGIQTPSWGYIEPATEATRDVLRRFQPVYWPFLVL
jgi:hypothetical protein